MRRSGVDTLVDARDVAIIGIPEIIRGLGKLYSAYRRLLAESRKRTPDVVVLIDWPDFNLRLARRLKREGRTILYYISPQIWAWRRYRLNAIKRDVTRMLVILPFEEEFYKSTGIPAEFVGHPLIDAVKVTSTRAEFCVRHGLDNTRPIIALMPGSREKELHYHLPAMLDAAIRLNDTEIQFGDGEYLVFDWRILHGEHETDVEEASNVAVGGNSIGEHAIGRNPQSEIHNSQSTVPRSAIHNPQFILPLASTVSRQHVETQIAGGGCGIKIIENDTYNGLAYSELAIVASGTATVEAALTRTPMVIVYRGSELNWRLIRPLIKLDMFGMVNLIAGRRIVPELIQHDCTGSRIEREASAILTNSSIRSEMKRELSRIAALLKEGGGNASTSAARAVMAALEGRQITERDA
jgi:lipid-A-disaccharide synthase